MCTTVAKGGESLIFGRNMDICRSFGERAVFTPRKFPLTYKKQETVPSHYAFLGTATVIDGYPLYAEGVNEKGLCVAALNFVGNAVYSESCQGNNCLAPYELIPKLLGECQSAKQAASLLEKTSLVKIPFKDGLALSELHFHIADKSENFVYEATLEGGKIYRNPINVLTNNPPFPDQLSKLSAYNYIKNRDVSPSFEKIAPYSLGLCGVGLPGDFSSSSRFVRAAYLLHYSVWDSPHSQMLHILNSVAVPKGAVYDGDAAHYTTYRCCIDAESGVYYYRAYDSFNTVRVAMDDFDLDGDALVEAVF